MKKLAVVLSCMWLLACDGDESSTQITVDSGMSTADSQSPTEQADMSGETDLGQTDAFVGTDAISSMDTSVPDAATLAVTVISQDDDFAQFFDKRVVVFGVQIVGTSTLPQAKLLHAAHVMAEYLDNDEDGRADDPAVVAAMVNARSVLVMAQTPDELENSGLFESSLLFQYAGQDLYGEEANEPDRFDATLEEVLHLISNYGYAPVYPEAFATEAGTLLSDAMDVARGGRFERVPNTYPDGAWYTYDDQTCEYECMATEYLYWALTSMLGAQEAPDRCNEISREWRLCTRDQVEAQDPTVFELLTDPQYRLPTVLPDGAYTPPWNIPDQ